MARKCEEDADRYQLRKASQDDALQEASRILRDGGKVLWVCNTVDRATKVLEKAENLPVQLFHSRYRYKDRLKRQRQVIDGFAPGKPAILAVTTQVAEMSLDLSCDLLISEWAPIPAMIQRLGRLNRFDEIPKNIKTALFIEPENRTPYREEYWIGVEEWLDRLCDGQPVSQRKLMGAFLEISGKHHSDISPALRCEWFDGLWFSLKDKRAIEEASCMVEVIREEDLALNNPVENAIPMPIPPAKGWQSWRTEGRYLVAPRGAIIYDEFRGAKWNRP